MSSKEGTTTTTTTTTKEEEKKKKETRPPPEEGRCSMWLESRHRYCHMQRTRGSLYCKPHTPDAARVPCPLDPHHTVLPQDLEKHLKRCPGTALSRAAALPYYHKDCNAGSDSEDAPPSSAASASAPGLKRARCTTPNKDKESKKEEKEEEEEEEEEEEGRRRAEAGVAAADGAVVRGLAAKVAAGYARACVVLPALEGAAVEQLHSAACDRYDTECSRKHAAQHTSILAHMARAGMLRRGAVFLELGAGTAYMSHLVSLCLAPEEVVEKPERPAAVAAKKKNTAPLEQEAPKQEAPKQETLKEEHKKGTATTTPEQEDKKATRTETFVLVDRGRFRHKAERMHRYQNPGHVFERVLMDIRDLDLARVDTFRAARAVVAYGKHLCGAATDLALRCIHSWFGTDAGAPVGTDAQKDFCAVAIALCCFHCCDWRSYTGKAWLQSLGFTRDDFPLLRSLTSWNTSNYPLVSAADATAASATAAGASPASDAPSSTAGDHGFTPSEKRRLGMQARHILIAGRVLYLRQHGFDTRVVTYVPETISPENLLLLAVWNRKQ